MNPRRPRATLAVSCFIHFLHEGCSELLYLLFPVWAREFSISFAQVGIFNFSGDLGRARWPAGVPVMPALLAAVVLVTLPLAQLFRPTVGSTPRQSEP
jgi:hypothetical protein